MLAVRHDDDFKGLALVCACAHVKYLFADPIYPTPPLGQDMTQGHFKWSLTGLNSEFSFS